MGRRPSGRGDLIVERVLRIAVREEIGRGRRSSVAAEMLAIVDGRRRHIVIENDAVRLLARALRRAHEPL